MDPLYTLPQAAAILRLYPKTLQRYARLGRIGCVRIGIGRQGLRFQESDLAAFVAAHAWRPAGQTAVIAITDYQLGPGRPNPRAKTTRAG